MASTIRGPFVIVGGPNRYDLVLKSFLYGEWVHFDLDPKGEATAYGSHTISVQIAGTWHLIAINDFTTGGDYFHFFGIVEMGALGRYCRGFLDAKRRRGVIFTGSSDSHKEISELEIPRELERAVYHGSDSVLRKAVTLYRKKQLLPAEATVS